MKIVRGQTKALFPQLRGSLGSMVYPAFAELKFDGEFCEFHWYWDKEQCQQRLFLINKHGTMRSDWSFLDIMKIKLEKKGISDIIMVGELMYKMGINGDLYKLLSNKDNNEDLRFIPFDVIRYQGQNLASEPLITRKEILNELNILQAKPIVVQNKDEVMKYFHDAIESNFEGIVVKSLEGRYTSGPCDWAKIKNKDQSDYEVITIDPTRDRIEVLVKKGQNSNHVCGVKCMPKDKVDLKLGDWVKIEHQGQLDTGGLRHPVYKRRRNVPSKSRN